ncbi:hypothetical protein FRB90_001362 [Tulasnella sp. 427]|nr:hypothetical protein FRB90_001362 [Tulasnella sp. 427]
MTVSALLPSTAWPRPGAITPAQASIPRDRVLSLVVQHILPPRPAAISQSLANAIQQTNVIPPTPEPPRSPPPTAPYALRRSVSTLSVGRRSDSTAWGDPGSPSITESGAATPIVQSPTIVSHDEQERGESQRSSKTSLPSPFHTDAVAKPLKPGQLPELVKTEESAVMFLGSSVLNLPSFRLRAAEALPTSPGHKSPNPSDEGTSISREAESGPRAQSSTTFSLEYVALREGFCPIGGLRVLLVEDREVGVEEETNKDGDGHRIEPKIIKEWDSIGEIWAKGLS